MFTNACALPLQGMLDDVQQSVVSAESSGSNDEKVLRRLTGYEFQARALKLGRASASSTKRTWSFHGEASPCKIVSLRSTPAHFGTTPPATGCRLLVQALVKFDTWQVRTGLHPFIVGHH
jgi:hypothetical protein